MAPTEDGAEEEDLGPTERAKEGPRAGPSVPQRPQMEQRRDSSPARGVFQECGRIPAKSSNIKRVEFSPIFPLSLESKGFVNCRRKRLSRRRQGGERRLIPALSHPSPAGGPAARAASKDIRGLLQERAIPDFNQTPSTLDNTTLRFHSLQQGGHYQYNVEDRKISALPIKRQNGRHSTPCRSAVLQLSRRRSSASTHRPRGYFHPHEMKT
ncbi:uncharacterized protein LOC124153213 [Ischnura elegans]|uniref:uncharacterized protein LOC124153213 n=1 Tax=Ischnura elegans TaxID=197161 RepID=UPI001ED888D0|nr:uncharacterized protein LOC124153213 [Ischnura elegans]